MSTLAIYRSSRQPVVNVGKPLKPDAFPVAIPGWDFPNSNERFGCQISMIKIWQFNASGLRQPSGGSYVLVEGEEVIGIIARFEVLEPCVIGAISAPDAVFSFTFHDVYVIAVVHG